MYSLDSQHGSLAAGARKFVAMFDVAAAEGRKKLQLSQP